jgi:hypothetical protein
VYRARNLKVGFRAYWKCPLAMSLCPNNKGLGAKIDYKIVDFY